MDLFYGLSRRFWVAHHARMPDSFIIAGRIHANILRAIALSRKDEAVNGSNELIDYLEAFTRRTIQMHVS